MEDEHSLSSTVPRKPRISAAEVEERMLRAAQEIVLETGGVTISLEDMSMEDVMRRAGVPRSSVYRKWPYKGDFVNALLRRLASPDWVGSTSAARQRRAFDVAWAVIEANKPRLATLEGRREVLRETVRRAVLASFQEMTADPAWPVYLALASTVGSVRESKARSDIASALRDFEKARVDVLVAFFKEISQLLGIRPRDGYSWEHVVVATGSMMQGLLMRRLILRNVDPRTQGGAEPGWRLDEVIDGPMTGEGLDGGEAEWSLVAVAYLGILESMLEFDEADS